MSTTKKRSRKAAARRPSTDSAKALLAAARAAIKRRDFAKARLLLRRVIAMKGASAKMAQALLKAIERSVRAKKARTKDGGTSSKKGAGTKKAPRAKDSEEAVAMGAPSLPPSRYPPLQPHGPSRGDEFEWEEFRSSRSFGRGADSGAGRDFMVSYYESPLAGGPDLSPRYAELPRTPVVVERIPHLRPASNPTAVGAKFHVDVYANKDAAAPGEYSEGFKVFGVPGQTQFDVDVWMPDTDHFKVLSRHEGVLTVLIDRNDTEPVPFELEVRKAASEHERPMLYAYFFYNGRPCGKVGRVIPIGALSAGGGAGDTPRDRIEFAPDAELADIVVDVTDPGKTQQHFQVKIRSRLLASHEQPAPGEWHLPRTSGDMVDYFMKKFTSDSADGRLRALGAAGEAFFKASPQAFQDLYWKLVDRDTPPNSILVTSEEPFVPWELMVPVRHLPDATRQTRPQPLGVECIVGRWIHEDHVAPRPKIPLTSSYVVAPDYPGPSPKPLAHAANEVNVVLAAVRGDRISPADINTLDVRLGAEGRSLLHLVCHGANSPGFGVQCIYLDGGVDELSSDEISQLKGLLAAFKEKPLVFLNACEVGRPTITLSGIGGFAGAFIDIGAAAVIAPLWSVRDAIAYDVAQRFYDAVKAAQSTSRPYADILREIRALAYDPAIAEDTYAAYCFYGDPFATP